MAPGTVTQEELIAFLQSPSSYPEHAPGVEIRQTHISIVALTATHAYKVKKPRNLGFLDFSTLQKRRTACEAELRLNQRLSHDIYLEVLPISRGDSVLKFGASGENGEVVDYAVKMRRLPEDGFLHRRLSVGAASADDINKIVDKLSRFYSSQRSTAEIDEWGKIENLRISTDENFKQTKKFAGTLITRPAFQALQYSTARFYDRHAELLERRRTGGHILDCHGDLRCEHIHFSDRDVNIFDCIEFNERFRFIDVANDIAFLAMDLDHLQRRELAVSLTSRMAEALNDPDLLTLVDFYKCYRAYVRGKVFAIKSTEPEVPAPEREASQQNARRFFQLALSYAIAGSQPLLLAVTGRIGTGKSSVARVIGDSVGADVFSSDRIRKELAGVDPYVRGDATARRALYSSSMTTRTYDTMISRAIAAARAGGVAILDATFGKPEDRALLRAKVTSAGATYRIIELEASDEQIAARLRERETSTAEVSDARLEDFDALATAYQPVEEGIETRLWTATSVELTARGALQAVVAARQ